MGDGVKFWMLFLMLTRNYSREKTYTNGRVGFIGPQRLETDSKGSVRHRTLILVSISGFSGRAIQ